MSAKAERASSPSQSVFSIRVVANLTGISADTLRMWERRYGFPKPTRNSIGVRGYSDEDIKRLNLINRAMSAGYRAGDAVQANVGELERDLSIGAGLSSAKGDPNLPVEAAVASVLAGDPYVMRDILRSAAATLGPLRFLTDVVVPLLGAIGDGWMRGQISIAQEHLATEIISEILKALRSGGVPSDEAPLLVFTTLPGERHGLGLEMVALAAASQGARILYLGVDTPLDQIVETAGRSKAQAVILSLSESSELPINQQQLSWLRAELPHRVDIWIGGAKARDITVGPGLRRVLDFDELKALIGKKRLKVQKKN